MDSTNSNLKQKDIMENNSTDSNLKQNENFNIIKNESKHEKLFKEVLGKKYNRENGELKLFREDSGISIIERNKTIMMTINDNLYYISIDKNSKTPYLDIFKNTGITSLVLFTAVKPIPSLIDCNNLTKIQLSFDNNEDTKYLDDLLKTIKNVENLQELDLRYLYYYWFSGYKDNILVIIDNIITSLKDVFPKLEYIYPDIYENSKEYSFIDLKNKKEILNIVTLGYKNLFNNYKETIVKNLKTLNNDYIKINEYIKTLDKELLESKKDLNKINELLQSKEYFKEINKLKKGIENYKKNLNNKLSDEEKSDVKNIIGNLTRELNIMYKNNEKKFLEEQIINLEKEKNEAPKFPEYIKTKIELLNKENSFMEDIEKKINENEYDDINIKEVYDFMLKIRTKGKELEIIHPFGQQCDICLDNIMIQDMRENNIKKTPCNHIFHKFCLNTWLYEKNSCPMCRTKINNNN